MSKGSLWSATVELHEQLRTDTGWGPRGGRDTGTRGDLYAPGARANGMGASDWLGPSRFPLRSTRLGRFKLPGKTGSSLGSLALIDLGLACVGDR